MNDGNQIFNYDDEYVPTLSDQYQQNYSKVNPNKIQNQPQLRPNGTGQQGLNPKDPSESMDFGWVSSQKNSNIRLDPYYQENNSTVKNQSQYINMVKKQNILEKMNQQNDSFGPISFGGQQDEVNNKATQGKSKEEQYAQQQNNIPSNDSRSQRANAQSQANEEISFQNSQVFPQQEPICVLNIELDDENVEEIRVYEGEDPRQIVSKFGEAFNLSDKAMQKLLEQIQSQIVKNKVQKNQIQ